MSWADYMSAMEMVDRACVFGIRFKDGQMPSGAEGAGVQWQGDVNAQTATFVRAHPAKLVDFMSVHPEEGDVVAEIERCVTDLGLKGIKLGPNYQGFDPLGRGARLAYETASGWEFPFCSTRAHRRCVPRRYGTPIHSSWTRWRWPSPSCASSWHTWAIPGTRTPSPSFASTRTFTPTCRPTSTGRGSNTRAWRLATEWNVLDKLVFGSDYPVATPRETLEGTLAVNRVVDGTGLPRVPEDALRAALERDTLALLGINPA
jgi:predicted TIM-barrel fold metal-dependent hydrolase